MLLFELLILNLTLSGIIKNSLVNLYNMLYTNNFAVKFKLESMKWDFEFKKLNE